MDSLLDNTYHDEEETIADAITFIIGGFHTTGTFLTWFFYYITLYPEIQDKVAKEVIDELNGQPMSEEVLKNLTYTTQVMYESLRHSALATFAARVNFEKDITVGGHVIPAKTPIMLSLGASLRDTDHYPNPEVFDPENFAPEKTKHRPSLAFSPFGFGIRRCPGYKFSYYEAYAAIAAIVPKFVLKPAVENDFKTACHYGFVSKPEKEIWIKISPRSME